MHAAPRHAPSIGAATVPTIAMVCVPEQSLPALLGWAASHQLLGLVCFSAVQAVQVLQAKSVGLIAIGEPPDAAFSDTLRTLRGVHTHSRFLYVPAHAGDLRCISGPPPGTDHVLVEPFTLPGASEILDRSWLEARRTHQTLIAGPIRIELGSRTLTVHGGVVALPAKGSTSWLTSCDIPTATSPKPRLPSPSSRLYAAIQNASPRRCTPSALHLVPPLA